jgi:hypothetical protein
VRALLPKVDAFLPVHNVESLEALARVLAGSAGQRVHRGVEPAVVPAAARPRGAWA